MKYITYQVRYAIVRGDMQSTRTYLMQMNPYSIGMSYVRSDALIFDNEEEIKTTIVEAKNNDYDENDYEADNWIIEPITEKEVFVQRLTR